jgi:hypothetical protein
MIEAPTPAPVPFDFYNLMHMAKPCLVLLALLFAAIVFVRIMRSRQIPRCVCCGARNVRASRTENFLEYMGKLVRIEPHRCDSCQQRFYAVLFRAPRPESGVRITLLRDNGKMRGLLVRRVVIEPAIRGMKKPGAVSGRPAVVQA